ncbi:hypothetical protein [Halalkalibacter sp. APA_J-10(15)]|uniref:hypothetical protein n=1 Tax=unclassified Halalkalibacter TaxID=2893063 RepID=UPI001FF6502F|nr:hypothetical protein [Halalkalibacter sp. APA_J-10(15)]MCK0472059.1 hypothetical protein [Halalkalibacter sp. APA_J-10(15)]
MMKQDILDELKKQNLDDILELIEDAESGDLEELEVVHSVGLLYDRTLNKQVIDLLKELGVTIINIKDEE